MILIFSSNNLRVDDLEPEAFSSLIHLIMGKLGYTWEDVLRCFAFMLNAETVQVPFNEIHVLREPPEHVFTRLANLNLGGNRLESWDEVNKLGNIKTLKSMNLRECGLKEIHFPSSFEEWETDLFKNLESLALSNNLLDDWVYISELDKLRRLVDLKFKDNPVLEKESLETNHQLLTTRIRRLEVGWLVDFYLWPASLVTTLKPCNCCDSRRRRDNISKRIEFITHLLFCVISLYIYIYTIYPISYI